MEPIRLSWLLGACLLLGGCGRAEPVTKKEIAIPEGGPPVLTSEERAEQGIPPESGPPAHLTGVIAQTSFEQPAAEPRMLRPLETWTEQEAAADALGRIGAAAMPELVRALENPDPAFRAKAVSVLGRMGPDAAAAVPALVQLLEDPDPAVRKATLRTLGQIGPAAKDAVPNLMRTLLEPTAQARSAQAAR